MAGISTRTQLPVNTIADTDLFLVSKDNGNGTFTSYKVAGSQMKLNYGASVPQSNKIYVDSVNGVNATGRGDINTPFLTPEYALTQINNTGTFTYTSTSGSNTLTSVSSTASIKKGQYITGNGIPYGSIVDSFTSNTIVLTKACTASGSVVTGTYYTFYKLIMSGNFTVTSNLLKRGVLFDAGDSTISFGALTLFNITSSYDVPFLFEGGYIYGTSSSSRFISTIWQSSTANFVIKPKYYYSNGTGFQFDFSNAYSPGSLLVDCPVIDCRFGSIADLYISRATFIGYRYSLLKGIRSVGTTLEIYGKTETPSSINAIEPGSGNVIINGDVSGQIYSTGGAFVINGNIEGTSHRFSGSEWNKQSVLNGDIIGEVSFNGTRISFIVNGNIEGNTTNACVDSTLTINGLKGTFTANSSSNSIIKSSKKQGSCITGITLTNGASVVCNGNLAPSNGGYCQTSIGAGTTLTINGTGNYSFMTIDGSVINYGDINAWFVAYGGFCYITGRLENRGGKITLTRATSENTGTTATIPISTGTVILNGGTLQCLLSDSKSGLFRKTASGGKLIFMGNATLKVANGLAPIQILSNTGTAQDILDFSVITNGASGFRLGDTFTDTTYGTAYAPNLLVNGDKKESTSYSW